MTLRQDTCSGLHPTPRSWATNLDAAAAHDARANELRDLLRLTTRLTEADRQRVYRVIDRHLAQATRHRGRAAQLSGEDGRGHDPDTDHAAQAALHRKRASQTTNPEDVERHTNLAALHEASILTPTQ